VESGCTAVQYVYYARFCSEVLFVIYNHHLPDLHTFADRDVAQSRKYFLLVNVYRNAINLSYIYLGSSVCLSSCHIPVVLSYSCHICGTLSYSLCFSNQTDQGDKTEGFEREGLEMER
jgi:hypothetical protein